ncbi:hypothetical protein AURDEDRAFT_122594 [Auricularia subglabra TFB-10046 SS5]|nr:hypothetical protein AURDEDRAFT_122594 [Auricularia subglabra TFB-10046 SS5]
MSSRKLHPDSALSLRPARMNSEGIMCPIPITSVRIQFGHRGVRGDESDNANVSITASASYARFEFAFLAFGGPYRIDETLSPAKSESLGRYLAEYEPRIRQHFGIFSGDIVILDGVTLAEAWMGGVARHSSLDVGGEVALQVSGVGIKLKSTVSTAISTPPQLPENSERRGVTCQIVVTQSPSSWLEDSAGSVRYNDQAPHEPDQRTIIRPVRVRKRDRLLAQSKRVFAVTGGRKDVDIQSVETDGVVASARGNSIIRLDLSGARGLGAGRGASNLDFNNQSALESSDSDADCEVDDDLLSIILQDVLDQTDSIQAVAGSWSVISDFVERFGYHVLDAGVMAKIEIGGSDVAWVAELMPSRPAVSLEYGTVVSDLHQKQHVADHGVPIALSSLKGTPSPSS